VVLAVATSTSVFPPIGIAIFGLGMVIAGRGYLEDRRLAVELSLLNDIDVELKRFIDRMDGND